ncbi:MAG TPA: guanitoxin biosynthesis heme-dependent pre-guanitoxin N-hydroxylase GntA [Schlesneria sp.]|jgi:hypothetical protein
MPDPNSNPFDSPFALQHSAYFRIVSDKPIFVAEPTRPPDLFAAAVAGAFKGFVRAPQFPCVGAKSAVMNENYWIGVYPRLASAEASAGLARDLFTFTQELAQTSNDNFKTFIACFREPTQVDEREFERLLWIQLQKLNIRDAPLFDWDDAVSSDPDSPHFAFSFAENAFFVVGLHPHSSREARRFPWPCLVFNSHAQFEHLKAEGRWEHLQVVIRDRDQKLQGTLNPNLTDYGTCTEARQYSGRQINGKWHPPFHPLSEEEVERLRDAQDQRPNQE